MPLPFDPFSAHDDDDILRRGVQWRRDGHRVALATVLRTWGSSPRPEGAQMVVRDDGAFLGSVSGGCIEGAVIAAARDSLDDGRPRVLEFGIADSEAWAVGLACGGRVEVLAAPLPDDLETVLERRAARQPAALLIDPERGYRSADLGALVPVALVEAAAALVRRGRSGLVRLDGERRLLRVYGTRWRLMVVGAVHIAQALLPMARMAGLETVLIDPRGGFATAERFPGARLIPDWPEEALAELALDRTSAVITLAHDPKLDDPALIAALESPAFYVGALGSRRTHAQRVERLTRAGVSAARIGRIQAPIGLDIGAVSPGEIAVSILAQIIAQLHRD